jgi:hypothetical protein
VLSTNLGTWQIAGNACEATLSVDRPRVITISLAWSRDPGPTENEHLQIALPDIVEAALDAVEQLAGIGEAIQQLLADGKICRIGTRDGAFVYAATDADKPDDTLADERPANH